MDTQQELSERRYSLLHNETAPTPSIRTCVAKKRTRRLTYSQMLVSCSYSCWLTYFWLSKKHAAVNLSAADEEETDYPMVPATYRRAGMKWSLRIITAPLAGSGDSSLLRQYLGEKCTA